MLQSTAQVIQLQRQWGAAEVVPRAVELRINHGQIYQDRVLDALARYDMVRMTVFKRHSCQGSITQTFLRNIFHDIRTGTRYPNNSQCLSNQYRQRSCHGLDTYL